MFRILFLALLGWILYNFAVKFVIPIYKTSQQLKKQFQNIKETQGGPQQSPENTFSPPEKQEQVGEYIDFEEVKEKS